MVQLSIPEAAVALGVSVDTVRRRIKAGLLRASRDDHGAYLVEMHDVPGDDGGPEHRARKVEPPPISERPQRSSAGVTGESAGLRPKATDRHLFKQEQRRASDFPQEIRGLRELIEVERARNQELREHLAFQRRQLEKAEAERERLVTILETQQQQFGIEQLQRILGEPPTRRHNER